MIAHEIAHSWTGNLVTNKNFEHFWLNEGFTVFVERKISGRMAKTSEDPRGEPQRAFQAIGGWKGLKYTVIIHGYFLKRVAIDIPRLMLIVVSLPYKVLEKPRGTLITTPLSHSLGMGHPRNCFQKIRLISALKFN